MDHEEAIRRDAASEYLLGELSGEEREQFEAHFFECPECAEEVRAGAIFEETLKAVLSEGQPLDLSIAARPGSESDARATGWQRWFSGLRLPVLIPSAACLVIALVAIGQFRELALYRQPQAVATYELRLARGGAPIRVAPDARQFVLSFDLPEGYTASDYLCEIRSGDGSEHGTVKLPAPAAGAPLQIQLPVRGYPAGSYRLVVHPVGTASAALEYLFTLEYRQE